VEEERLVTTVDGDLRGPARLDLRPVADGTEARLAWTFALQAPLLRALAVLGRPAMAWAHDRIVERGLVQFEGHALLERERDRSG
jgi:predicted DNA repair protein MutK